MKNIELRLLSPCKYLFWVEIESLTMKISDHLDRDKTRGLSEEISVDGSADTKVVRSEEHYVILSWRYVILFKKINKIFDYNFFFI